MLISIHVKNLALIEEVEIELQPGLNILTGETGAGKSILIESLNLALGGKGDKEFVRKGADFGLVELVFQTNNIKIKQKLEQIEVPLLDEDTIILSRRIQSNRSVSRINGEIVTMKQIKELAKDLIDLHGQHEHQSLLSKAKHLMILDFYAKEQLAPLQIAYEQQYKQWQQLGKQLKEETTSDEAKEREIDFLEFEIAEIQKANLIVDEDVELDKKYQKLLHQTKIQEALSMAYRYSGTEHEEGAILQVGRALRELRSVVAYEENLEEVVDQFEQVEDILNELNRTISTYLDIDDVEQENFYVLEQRINEINHLKDKYGSNIEAILAYEQQSILKLEKLKDFDVYIAQLVEQYEQLEHSLYDLGMQISKIRITSSKKLEKKLKEALLDLNFEQVDFQIAVHQKEQFNLQGFDEVEFLISTNPGEKAKSLGQVASGGELSRIMLGIKTVLNNEDEIETMIFDEIDTGISGKTAWKVSEKLSQIAQQKQVICITHLPQIAANADAHFYIEKIVGSKITETKIKNLNDQDMIQELARMLGSDKITDGAILNAKELKKMAGKI